MSWQSYVDDHLMCELPHKGTLKSAAIVGLDGNVWAQSAEFPAMTAQEASNIVGAFNDPADLAMSGLRIGGEKYMVIQGEAGRVIRGKKGESGVTIMKTNGALIFGIYDKPTSHGDCNIVVENLGDYLVGQGI
eukprot:jgi/Mesen1/2131/ME000152S01222